MKHHTGVRELIDGSILQVLRRMTILGNIPNISKVQGGGARRHGVFKAWAVKTIHAPANQKTIAHVHSYPSAATRVKRRASPAKTRPPQRETDATVCCFRACPSPDTSDLKKSNMPWRECIFTEAGVIFPPTWDMNAYHAARNISGTMVKSESTISPCQDISSSTVLTEQADAASSINTPKHDQARPIALQDHFAGRQSPATTSPPAAASPYTPPDRDSYGWSTLAYPGRHSPTANSLMNRACSCPSRTTLD